MRYVLEPPPGLGPPITAAEVEALLREGRFGAEYQPIVDLATGETVAHEALSRFRRSDGTPVPPAPVFAALHGSPRSLFEIELALKRFQIAHAPGPCLFLNLDPDSWATGACGGEDVFLELFRSAPHLELVVEAIENVRVRDALLGGRMAAGLHEGGVAVAIDDVGAELALLSLEAVRNAAFLKFDRSVVPRLEDRRDRILFCALARLARELGARTVLEGVERADQLEAAHALGVDFVQGFLFRDRFVAA